MPRCWVLAFFGANDPVVLPALGGLLLVGVLALGVTVLRHRGAAGEVLGELQTSICRRAFE